MARGARVYLVAKESFYLKLKSDFKGGFGMLQDVYSCYPTTKEL